jgi:hypothetical protein
MSEIIVTLGSVSFRDFEVPEEIIFGGGQMLAVHQMIGGGRVIDALGSEDGEISFSGTFSGPDAARRAQALDVARSLGASLLLAWNGFSYTVMIGEFVAAYTKPWWIPFSIRLVVVADLVVAVADAAVQAGLDLVSAQEFSAEAGIVLPADSIQNSVSLSEVQSSAVNAVTGSGQNLMIAAGTLNAAADVPAGVSAVANLAVSTRILANAAGVQAFIGRAVANLGAAAA